MSFHQQSQDPNEIEDTKSENVPSDPTINYEPPSISTIFTKKRSLIQDDDEEEKKSFLDDDQPQKSIQTLSDIPNELGIADIKRFKSMSMESRISINNKSRTIGWILSQLEDMGFEADPRTVRLTMRAYPPGTSRSFILETIVKDILQDEDERISSESMRESTRLRDGEGRDETFCRLCFILLDKNDDKFRVFACQDAFCRDCIYSTFKDRIENNENIETFRCPDNECKSAIIIDRFATLIPEVNHKDLGDTELGTCEICLETIVGSEDLLKVSQCQQHFYCYNCTLAYLKECINNRKVIDIKCPDSECCAFLDEEKIKNLLPVYLSQRYARFKKIAMTERNPNIRWCSRPGCEEILEGSPENLNLVCKCSQITCFICGNPNHKGKSCEQALEEEYKTYALKKDLQFCPECKSRVEKTEGCNHMTCPICTYEWCWLCKREYAPGHFDPINPLGCPGLMAGEHTRQNRNRTKLIFRRMLLVTAYILAIITSPAWLLILAMMVPNMLYTTRPDHGIRQAATMRFMLFLVGLVLLPLTVAICLIGAIIPGSCILTMRLLDYRRTRNEAKKRRKELIENRDERLKRGEHFLMGYTAVEENFRIDLNNEGDDLRVPLLGSDENLQREDIAIQIE